MTTAPSRRSLALGLAAFAAAGCTSSRDVYQGFRYPIPPPAQRLPQEELERVIVDAASHRGWRWEKPSAGVLHGTLPRWYGSTWVDLRVTRESYAFVFQPNSQLQRLGPGVPTDYERWMYNLKSDIDAGLRAVR